MNDLYNKIKHYMEHEHTGQFTDNGCWIPRTGISIYFEEFNDIHIVFYVDGWRRKATSNVCYDMHTFKKELRRALRYVR